MSDRKYKIGDSVWFKFDNGKKEQKGVIQWWYGDICGYKILGNVDSKVYFVKEEEISGIAPHKRLLDNEKKCSNCRWHDKCIDEYPCSICDGFNHTKWEPKEEKVDYRSFYPVTTGLSNPIYDSIRRQILTGLSSDSTWGIAQPTKLLGLNVNEIYFDNILKEDEPMNKKMVIRSNGSYIKEIDEVIFSGPATIVKYKERTSWRNQSNEKSVVKCSENDGFSKTTGFLLALVKSFVDKKSWNNILRIIDGFEEPEAEMATAKDVWDSLPQNLKDDIIEQEALKAINKSNPEEPVEISEVEPWMQMSKIPSVLAASLKHYKILENKKGLYDIYTPDNIADGGFKSVSQHRYHVGRTLHLFEKMVLSDILTDRDELRAVLNHLIICIDANKYHLDWKRSEKDRRIRDIDNKYKHIDYVDCVKKYLDSIK